MLNEKLNTLIAESMKAKDTARTITLRNIKSEFVKKEKDGKTITADVEASILLKMIQQREDAIAEFKKANRDDLVSKEQTELDIIKEFAPKVASDDEIIAETENVIAKMGGTVTMKDMRNILSEVQKTYPTANGKIISEIVKKHC